MNDFNSLKIGDRVALMGQDGKIRYGEIEFLYYTVNKEPYAEVFMETEGYCYNYPLDKLFKSSKS